MDVVPLLCRRHPGFTAVGGAVMDSLEPWRVDIAKALVGGEARVREALTAYLRCRLS